MRFSCAVLLSNLLGQSALGSSVLNNAHMLQLLTAFGQKSPSDSKESQDILHQRKVTISISLNHTEELECIEHFKIHPCMCNSSVKRNPNH